jgi:hypothetical protein
MGGRPAEDERTARIGSTLQIIECATDCSPRPAFTRTRRQRTCSFSLRKRAIRRDQLYTQRSMLGAAAIMIRMVRRVALTVLIISVAAGAEILGQNALPNVNRESSDDLVPVQQNGEWGYADRTGRVVIKPQFRRAGRFSEGLALVWTGGAPLTDPVATSFVRMGYIDPTGRWVIHSRFQYYFFDDFSEGLVPFRKQFGKWGYMDRMGKIVIRPQFDWAGDFSGGIAPALLDGRCAHLDKTGRVTDQSQAVLPRQKNEQDGHGTYRFKPHASPCS